ncbi:MAG TPA: hypothetical protein DIW31_09605 [Bacteroidales bacterium]|nr:hypothetical protein [Bacteroidales bacterium]
MRSNLNETKEYFTFSRSERRGILVLIFLIIVLILAPYFYSSFITNVPTDNSEFKAKVDSFFSTLVVRADDNASNRIKSIEEDEVVLSKENKYFNFDPNIIQLEDMVQLGLSVKQAQVVDRYRSKGGVFRSPEDFAKIYAIDSGLYRRLKPWIKIESNFISSRTKTFKDSIAANPVNSIIIEINSSDTLELLKIKGIGKIFARRIIAYRNLLGGFVSVAQLSDIYGMKPELLKEISKSIVVDSSLIKTININLVSFEDIKKHPYLTEYQAKAIIYYRSKVGVIKNIKELVENKLLPYDKYIRLKSYLVIH